MNLECRLNQFCARPSDVSPSRHGGTLARRGPLGLRPCWAIARDHGSRRFIRPCFRFLGTFATLIPQASLFWAGPRIC